jgi:hypothetical protein
MFGASLGTGSLQVRLAMTINNGKHQGVTNFVVHRLLY